MSVFERRYPGLSSASRGGIFQILHVLDSLQIGGTEWQCVSLVRNLDPSRFRSAFVCLNHGGALLEGLRGTSVWPEVIPFRGFRRPAGLMDVLRLAMFMRQHHIQIVQAYGFYSNVPALLAGRMAGVPILVASRRDMGEFLTRSQRLVERGIFRLADRVVVNAKAIERQLISGGQVRPERVVVIPNGVDLGRFEPGSWPDGRNGKPPWAGRGRVVGMVAKFREQKDHATFLRAAKLILAIDPTVVFVLAGGVSPGCAITSRLRDAAVRLAEEMGIASSVWFLGATDPGRVPALLRHVDVSVLASHGNEGIPNVILEAMAAGKPVVATGTGGCSEAIEDGITGFLVPPRDPERLADRILWLVRNEGAAARMGRAGRQRVEAEFSLSRMLGRFASLYDDLGRSCLREATEEGS